MEEKEILLRQIREWEAERDRLNEMIAAATGCPNVQVGLEIDPVGVFVTVNRYNAQEPHWQQVSCPADGIDYIPLYSASGFSELDRIMEVATGEVAHIYLGLCPDRVNGFSSRDHNCPACRLIMAAETSRKK